MIVTQRIDGVTHKPIEYKDYEVINVLKWSNSKWKTLCPYYLRTDGNEDCFNHGGVLFENFWQGMKVYDIVYENKVYSSKYQEGNLDYLWWHYKPINEHDVLFDKKTSELNLELYLRWRNDLWSCDNPIRYPNQIYRRKNTQFSLSLDKDGNETRMDYITSRKNVYMKEYCKLIRKLPEYKELLKKLNEGTNLMICEVDVPSSKKKGNYYCGGTICDTISLDYLNVLLNDPAEAFGHGLCLAYALLEDYKPVKKQKSITSFFKSKTFK